MHRVFILKRIYSFYSKYTLLSERISQHESIIQQFIQAMLYKISSNNKKPTYEIQIN